MVYSIRPDLINFSNDFFILPDKFLCPNVPRISLLDKSFSFDKSNIFCSVSERLKNSSWA